jgi:DNA polymerase I-like protein with 3'-5' exonuclease and polymerase domains
LIQRSFDTETGGLDAFEPAEQAFLATWSDERGNDHVAHQTDARAMAAFESDMRASDVLVAHNLSFDVHQLRETSGLDLLTFGKTLIDTDQLARVVLPERRAKGEDEDSYGFKLEALSKTFLPADEQKHDLSALAKKHGIRLKQTGGYLALWKAEPEAFEAYAMADTRSTLGILPHLQAKLTEKLTPTWELERQVTPHLIRAEARGVAIDQDKVQPLKASYIEKRDVAYASAVGVLGEDAISDPTDPDTKDDSEALCEALLSHGVPLHRRVKSCDHGDAGCNCPLTTNKFALQEFADDFPVIADLQTYRTAAKFLSTYIGPMDGRDEVHASYFQLGPWTGRMSCSRPNLQNIPVRGEGASELREMFVPRPGYCFVVSDYDQIELRLLAHYLHSDSFKELAANLAFPLGYLDTFGPDPSRYRKGQPGEKKRSDAKNTTYAISYAAGGGRISDMLGLDTGPPLTENDWTVKRGYQQAGMPSHKHARQIISMVKSWLPNYEELAGRKGRIYKKVARDGFVSTINGRKQIVGKDKAYVGLNAIIQGSGADIFKQGFVNASEAVAHLGAQPVLLVHDEIGTECPIEHAEECRRLQDAAMRDAWDLYPSLQVSSSIAYNNYSEAK